MQPEASGGDSVTARDQGLHDRKSFRPRDVAGALKGVGILAACVLVHELCRPGPATAEAGQSPLLQRAAWLTCGLVLLGVLPGWPWVRAFARTRSPLDVLVLSLMASFYTLVGFTTVYKLMGLGEVGRTTVLCCAVAVGVAGGATRAVFGRSAPLSSWVWTPRCAFLGCVALLSAWIVAPELLSVAVLEVPISLDAMMAIPLGGLSDNVEAFALAQSLKTHVLPYTSLEYAPRLGYYGIDPPANIFINHFSLLLFENRNVAQVAPNLGYLVLTFAVVAVLAERVGGTRRTAAVSTAFCAGSVVTSVLLVHDPSDLASTVFHTSLFLLLQSVYLADGRTRMFMLTTAHSMLVKCEAGIVALLAIGIWYIVFRPGLRLVWQRAALVALLCFGLASAWVVMALSSGEWDTYVKILVVEKGMRYDHWGVVETLYDQQGIWESFRLRSSVAFAWKCSWASAWLWLPTLVLFRGVDRLGRYLWVIGAFMLLAVFFSRYQLDRYAMYVSPFFVLSGVLSLRLPLANRLLKSPWRRSRERSSC